MGWARPAGRHDRAPLRRARAVPLHQGRDGAGRRAKYARSSSATGGRLNVAAGLGGPVPDRGARPRDPRGDARRAPLADRRGGPPISCRRPSIGRAPCSRSCCRSLGWQNQQIDASPTEFLKLSRSRQGVYRRAGLRRPRCRSTSTTGASRTELHRRGARRCTREIGWRSGVRAVRRHARWACPASTRSRSRRPATPRS